MRLKHRRSPPIPAVHSTPSAMLRSIFVAGNDSDSYAAAHLPPEYSKTTFFRRSIAVFIFLAVFVLICNFFRFIAYSSSSSTDASSSFVSFVFPSDGYILSQDSEEYKLEKILKDAATEDNTVIITTLNEAWAAPNSIIDLFLESFRLGFHTRKLLKHLVIVALDDKAFRRCLSLHTHCFALPTEGVDFSKEAYFMTPDYLKMMWRRIDFLRGVLEMGYNFIFTDADIMWFRDPFRHLFSDADFQIACDHFTGNSSDIHNRPNGGFNYVKSNNKSIEFYKFWYSSQDSYPGYHDQDVLNFIKHDPYIEEIGLKMRFLDTAYFSGFCELSKDLNEICTMHANCCCGMDSKLHDLRIVLQDWRLFMSLPPSLKQSQMYSWRVPMNCSLRSLNPTNSTEDNHDDQENGVDGEEK